MRRYALRKKDFMPGREGHVGGAAADNRLFVDAVLYRYRAASIIMYSLSWSLANSLKMRSKTPLRDRFVCR